MQLLLRDGLCTRVFTTVGLAEPLDSLHSMLTLAHSVPLGPAAHLMLSMLWSPTRGDAPEAAEQLRHCRAIEDWLHSVVGVLLPLAVLVRMEAAARRAFESQQQQQPQLQRREERGRQQQQGAAVHGSAAAAPVTDGSNGGGDTLAVGLPRLIPRTLSHCYFASCIMWVCALAVHGA